MKKKRTPVESLPPNVEWYTVEELAARWRGESTHSAAVYRQRRARDEDRNTISDSHLYNRGQRERSEAMPKPSGRVDMSEFETEVDYTG